MPTHDFRRLSNLDFEELVHDLLEAEWGKRLEFFKQGRDGGIDLRRIDVDGGATIVQCKHYLGSGFAALKGVIRREELAKVRKLAPMRYVLATSLPLSAKQKGELVAVLAPYVLNPGDIVSGTEIEALLRKHPAVERAHYKLWLASTAVLGSVLESFLHAAEKVRTGFSVDNVRRAMPKFVRCAAYDRALESLNAHRVAIISGAPGIGKTTLANVLMLEHLERDYVPVVIGDDVAEGRRQARPGTPTIFHFDDFLGQTHLGDRPDFLGRREDAAIVEFLEMVKAHEEFRFVLTTRAHILSDALRRSERLRHADIEHDRCVIEIGDYSREHRARILYQHLWFGGLPAEYRRETLRDDFFLKVIDHEHYNPRVVEWLSSLARLRGVGPAEYQAHVSTLLDDPAVIWDHAFRQQLSEEARSVLLAQHSLGVSVPVGDLEDAWRALHDHRCRKYNVASRSTAFRDALKELDGAFLSYESGWASFINPSVRDFLGDVLAEDHESVADILATAVEFVQLANLWRQSADAARFPDMRERLCAAPEVLLSPLTRLLGTEARRFGNRKGAKVCVAGDPDHVGRANLAIEVAEALRCDAARAALREAMAPAVAELERGGCSVARAATLLETAHAAQWLSENGGREILEPLLDEMAVNLERATGDAWLCLLELESRGFGFGEKRTATMEAAFAAYVDDGAWEEGCECDEVEEMEALLRVFERLRDRFGADLSSEIGSLKDWIYERMEPTPDSFDAGPVGKGPIGEVRAEASDAALRDMFGGLVA